MRITRPWTLISLSAMFSQNQLNPIMQRANNDRSVQRALPVYNNAEFAFFVFLSGTRIARFDTFDLICLIRSHVV